MVKLLPNFIDIIVIEVGVGCVGAILGVTLLVLLATSAGYFCRVPGYDAIDKVDRPLRGSCGS